MNQVNPANLNRNPTTASKRPTALALACLLVAALPATVTIYAGEPASAGAEHSGEQRGKHHKRPPVSLAELSKHAEERFARLDTDTDGRVTRDEFLDADRQGYAGKTKADGREHPKRRFHKQRKQQMRKQTMAADAPEREAAIFSALDKDGNGALSAEEFAARREVGRSLYEASHRNNRFEELDTNADGHLSADELNVRLNRLRELDSNNNGILERNEMREIRALRRAERRG